MMMEKQIFKTDPRKVRKRKKRRDSSNLISEESDISLIQLVDGVNNSLKRVLSKWKLIASMGLLGGLLGVGLYLLGEDEYQANLTFIVNEDSGDNFGRLSGILGAVGLGNIAGAEEVNNERILSIAKSNSIIIQALYDNIGDSDTTNTIGDWIISTYDLEDAWVDNKYDIVAKLPKRSPIEQTSDGGGWVLNELYAMVAGGDTPGLLSTELDEDTGIMKLSTNTLDPNLSLQLVKAVYAHLSDYYIQRAVEPQYLSYKLVSGKADSLQNAIYAYEAKLAKIKDTQRAISRNQNQNLTEERNLNRAISITTLAYGKTIESLGMAEYALRTQTPVFQSVNWPIPPIEAVPRSLVKNVLIGGFLVGFLATVLVIYQLFTSRMSQVSMND